MITKTKNNDIGYLYVFITKDNLLKVGRTKHENLFERYGHNEGKSYIQLELRFVKTDNYIQKEKNLIQAAGNMFGKPTKGIEHFGYKTLVDVNKFLPIVDEIIDRDSINGEIFIYNNQVCSFGKPSLPKPLTIKDAKGWALYKWCKQKNDYRIHSNVIRTLFRYPDKTLPKVFIQRTEEYAHGRPKELIFDQRYYNDITEKTLTRTTVRKIEKYYSKMVLAAK